MSEKEIPKELYERAVKVCRGVTSDASLEIADEARQIITEIDALRTPRDPAEVVQTEFEKHFRSCPASTFDCLGSHIACFARNAYAPREAVAKKLSNYIYFKSWGAASELAKLNTELRRLYGWDREGT